MNDADPLKSSAGGRPGAPIGEPSSGPDLRVRLAGLTLRNPVMTASGTFGYGTEYADLVDYSRLGGLITKGVSMEPWDGNPLPRMVEVRAGLVNAIGLQNPGAKKFCEEYLPFLRRCDVPVFVNIWGRSVADYVQVAEYLGDQPGIDGLEINISCPNIKQGGITFSADLGMAAGVIRAVRACTPGLLMPKLSPTVPRIADYARMAEDEGADAISLINTLPAMVIDVETRRPVLGNRIGGLSGPAIHPVAVKLVYEAASAVQIPVVAMGGITDTEDALEFLIAGATAVAVGSANFSEPAVSLRIVDGIAAFLRRHHIDRVIDLIGSVEGR